jgi:CBS domain-containing protein
MSKLVRDLMHPGVLTCDSSETIGQVAETLYANHVHALFVAGPDGQIKGVITDFDLLAGEWLSVSPDGLNAMRKMTAGELMSSPVGTIEADVSASEAAHRMQSEVIRRLLVTDNGKPVGVISVSDFIANVAEMALKSRATVADVMSDVYLACREKTPVVSAARAMADTGWRSVLVVSASRMIENHHHRLVVVDPEHPNALPLGIISSFDIVAEMARPDSVWQT